MPAATAQESRTERVAVAITPSEKRAIVAVAALRATDQSSLLREMSVDQAVAEFERVQAAAATPDPAA